MFLAHLTSSEFKSVAGPGLTALIPLGSTEQHGSIGPLGTDFTIPEELCREAEKHLRFPRWPQT